jgi:outer membrane protein OmpA-like peptidoglycan-associated protein/Tol biopolymer transport system component
MKTTLSLFLFMLAIICCYGQEDKMIKKGDDFFKANNYFSALKIYEKALESDKTNAYLHYKIANCYLETSPKSKALQFAFDAVKYSEKPVSDIYYTLARAYHINHEFNKAIEFYQKSDPGNKNKRIISKLINECGYGKQYVGNPINVKITNAGPLINTPFQEYLPYITADMSKLYFTSRKPGSTGGKKDSFNAYYEDIYVALNKGGAWDTPRNAGSPLNSPIHDACVGLSENGQTMFIYKSDNGGDIYTSELKGEKWTKPVAMPLNTEFFETTACLSPDERTLFFVRKVMTGSRDIYICNRTIGGTWSKPKKMDVINTEFDEDAPFIHPDGKTLFFSSRGHSSMGGYDVFKSTKTEKGWGPPENLGYPINTAGDDVYFVLSANGKVGFYSSEKDEGFGQHDIYSIRMPVNDNDPELALMTGTIKDESTGKAIEANITITDNETKETIAKFASNSTTGEYLVSLPSGRNYGVTIEKEKHLFYSENVFLMSKEGYKEIRKNITLISAQPGAKVILKNIFFESGKYDLRPESTLELQRLVKLLQENPGIKIEISGHTDNTGDPGANQILSENRAKQVLNYLINNGIDTKRLTAKGYGSLVPIASNDTEDDRKQNRRTEFKIL